MITVHCACTTYPLDCTSLGFFVICISSLPTQLLFFNKALPPEKKNLPNLVMKKKKKHIKKYPSGGDIAGNGPYPDFSGLDGLADELNDLFTNSPAWTVDPITGVPAWNQEGFNEEISANLENYFSENPIPALPIGNYTAPFSGLTDLLNMQQNPYLGDPFHKNMVNTLTVGPNQGFRYGGPLNQFMEGGEVAAPVLTPIQTEKGEYISFEDNTIAPVLAKKSHKAQETNDVTDLLPDGAFVYSQDKKMRLKKKKADDLSFGYAPVVYDENDTAMTPPDEILFGDIFRKKEELPADLAKRVRQLYPVTDREEDAFSNLAKEENLSSRQPYLEGIKVMSEMKKTNTDTPIFQLGGAIFSGINPTNNAFDGNFVGFNDPFQQRDNALMAADGLNQNRFFRKGGQVPKYPIGGIIEAGLNIVPNIVGLFQQGKQNKAMRAAMEAQLAQANRVQDFAEGQYQNVLDTRDRLLPIASDLYSTQQGNLQNASLMSLAGIMGQDTGFDAPDLSSTRSLMAAQADRVPNAVRNQAMQSLATPFRNIASNLGRVSPSQRGALLSRAGANELTARSQTAANFAGQDINLGNRYLQQLAGLEQQNANNLANQANQIRNNSNTQLGSAANVGTNFFNQSNQIAQGNLANQLAIEASVAPGLAGALNSMNNATNGMTGAYGLMQPLAQGQGQLLNGFASLGNNIFNLGNHAGWWGNGNSGGTSGQGWDFMGVPG